MKWVNKKGVQCTIGPKRYFLPNFEQIYESLSEKVSCTETNITCKDENLFIIMQV